MPRTNLSLGNLFRAVSGSVRTGPVSLGGLAGGVQASMRDGFATDKINVNPPQFTYIVESTTENANFTFEQTGSLFNSKVQRQLANFTCSFNNSNFTTGSNTFETGPTIIPITPGAIAQSTYSEASAVLTMGYADGYNLAATNYGVTTTRTLYAVDVYNTINQPDFCLLFGTKVTKADGTEINVEDLVVGDSIKAWVPTGLPDEDMDPSSPEVDWTLYMRETVSGDYQNVTVADLVFNFASGYYDINNGLIKSTGTHPVFVWDSEIEKYRFKKVENILIGDLIVTYDEMGGISEIEVYDKSIINSDVEIVTINVEDADVYLANKIISHNKGGALTTQQSIPATGLRMYVDQYKTASYNSGSADADWLDLSGWNTGVRPAGVQNAAGITGGNPTVTTGAGRISSFVTFNGTNQFFYKDTTTNINGGYSQFNTNTGTIHLWVRPTTASIGAASRFIFDYAGFYGLAIESTDSSAYNRVRFYGSSLGNSAQLTTSLAVGTNYLISVTFQPSGTCTIYVDGTSIGTFTSSAFTAPSSTNFVTIGSNSARTSFWNGGIQAVLFYNVLQTSTEVQQVYNHFSRTLK